MDAQSPFQRYLTGGLDAYGVEYDDIDLAVADAVWKIYGELLRRLMEADLDGVEPETDLDLSRAPRS